jgi:filamentous hemagglutinin
LQDLAPVSDQPFMGNDCVTAECAAGMAPFRGHNSPDYISAQGSVYFSSGGFAINLHNGETFGQWGLCRAYPGYSVTPGFAVNVGTIVGGGNAQTTSDFLKGGSVQGNIYVPSVPAVPLLNVGGGINHSYGGRTSVEVGVSTQPGASVSPIGYGFSTGEKSGAAK